MYLLFNDMDNICDNSETDDFSKTITNVEEAGVDANATLRCESPVFKCVNQIKPNKGCNSESDNDIPSYQVNQSSNSRTSSKYGNETSDTVLPVLPFSPVFSPIPVPSHQFQPPSVHTLGSVFKRLNGDKSCKEGKETKKASGPFESLGMTDKDISWVSSMASPPPAPPESEFNTIERATFLPEEKFLNIQPRALFSPTFDDDCGCQPLTFSSASEDEETYKTNMRLSDVCATLTQLKVKSLEQVLTPTEKPSEGGTSKSPISPVIKTTKKKKSLVRKKKDILVISPEVENNYEFSVSNNLDLNEKSKGSGQNFIEDDSFQSISFSCIDELCKTLVNSTGGSGNCISQSSDCDKTLVNHTNDLKSLPKQFYNSRGDVFVASSLDNLHSHTKALVEGDLEIVEGVKIDKSVTDKGIVRFSVLDKNSSKVDATKRLHSELSVEKKVAEKKFKKENEESNWDTMSKYLSESQLNVSESELFRTVEKLEKTLGSQEGKEGEKGKLKIGGEVLEKNDLNQNLTPVDEAPSGTSCLLKESLNVKWRSCADMEGLGSEDPTHFGDKPSNKNFNFDIFKGFTTASGNKVTVSTKSLERSKELLSKCDVEDCTGIDTLATNWMTAIVNPIKNSSEHPVDGLPSASSTTSESKVTISEKPLPTQEVLRSEEDVRDVATSWSIGFSTCSGRKIQVSTEALEKAKALLSKCDEKTRESSDELASSWMKGLGTGEETGSVNEKTEVVGFSTASGSKVVVSEKALRKGKELMTKCEKEFLENCKNDQSDVMSDCPGGFAVGFSTGLGNPVKVSEEALEKAKTLMSECDGIQDHRSKPFVGFSTAGGSKVTVSEVALAKAKEFMAEFDEIKPEVSTTETAITTSKTEVVESTTTLSTTVESGVSNLTEGDWDEIIPSWLHVYNTSPSIASDRVDLSPVLSHEDGKLSKPDSEYMIKSPVLGASDRFYKKVKRKKLRFEDEAKTEPETSRSKSFTIPYKNSERKSSGKRSRANLSVDFTAPFKKVKFVEDKSEVWSDVKEERKTARKKQEEAVKEKQKVKPLKGSHLSKKSSEKQMTWKEAVGGYQPEVHSMEFLRSMSVKEDVLMVDVNNAVSFRFCGKDYYGSTCLNNVDGIPVGDGCLLILDDENKAGVEEFERAFLASPGVEPKLVPPGWLENHYKWIVWKLAHYERSLPRFFGGRALTPNNVMIQLKYRYDRDIDRNERSALKKILERDDASVKRLVLCVCGVKKITIGDVTGYELNLTDGWYSCPARTDSAMTRLVEEGKIFVGMKLVTQGATLVNCEQGVSPLEISGDVHLKISTNSTRRVRWDTKLGFQKNPDNIKISLGSILPQGGQISRVDVIAVRVYPVLYMEKTSDGHHVTRNRRSEEKAEAEFRKVQEQRLESICNEIRSEIQKCEEMVTKESSLSSQDGGGESSSDPSALREKLSGGVNQKDNLSKEVLDKLKKKLENEKLHKRNVSEFLRVKIVDFQKRDYNNPGVLSVWNPNEEVLGMFSEGKVLSLTNITVSNSSRSFKPIQLNTTRQTQYREVEVGEGAKGRLRYPARKSTLFKELSSKTCPALFEEIDLVGVVIFIQDVSFGSRSSQIIYLTDLESNYIGVPFWGSCKDYCWENMLTLRSVVACSNLQWKASCSLEEVPSLHVTVHSVFTQNPKQSHLREEMERIKKKMPEDLTSFLSKCEEELKEKLEKRKRQPLNVSSNSSGVKDEPPVKLRLNGFESGPAASSTPIKALPPGLLSNDTEPSPIQKRIEKLQKYGEPPPLFPLIISNNARRTFRKKS